MATRKSQPKFAKGLGKGTSVTKLRRDVDSAKKTVAARKKREAEKKEIANLKASIKKIKSGK